MKKTFVICLVIIFSFYLASSLGDFPNYQDKYVNDFAKIFNSEESTQMRGAFTEVETQTTAEVVFVSMESIGNYDISDYAVKLANQWKVGKADKNNGLLILYVKDINRIFVATGYGLEGILPDSKIGRMLDTYYVPYRDEGNASLGILIFSSEIIKVLIDNKEEIKSGQTSGNNDQPSVLTVIVIILVFLIFIRIVGSFGNRRSNGLWWLPIFIPSGRSSGGFGGGFGGGGFGGGGFGGGGAGR